MDELARQHYAALYALIYFGAIAAVALWEAAAPRRALAAPLRLRWFGNIGVSLIHSALTWWLFPLASLGFALVAADRGWGVLRVVEAPYPLALVLSLVALDLARYVQHRLLHGCRCSGACIACTTPTTTSTSPLRCVFIRSRRC